MNRHHGDPPQSALPPPPPALPPINQRSASARGILRGAAAICYARLSTFLVIAIALCFIRFAIEEMYLHISDKSEFYLPEKSLLTRMDFKSVHIFSSGESFSNNSFEIEPLELEFRPPSWNTPNSSGTISFPQITLPNNCSSSTDFDFGLFIVGFKRGRIHVLLLARFLLFTIASYSCAVYANLIAYICARGIVLFPGIDGMYGRQTSSNQSMICIIARAIAILLLIIATYSYRFEILWKFFLIGTSWLFPSIQAPDWEISDFVTKAFCTYIIVEHVSLGAFAVAFVGDWEMNRVEYRQESSYILVVLLSSAVEIRMMEAILCANFGNLGSFAVQCVMEVFMLVAWVLYYLSTRTVLWVAFLSASIKIERTVFQALAFLIQ